MKTEIEAKFDELESLLKKMDIPSMRYRSIFWLKRNLAIRNSAHKNFPRANEIIEELSKMGIR